MIKIDYLKYIFLFILLVLVQTLILNNIVIEYLFYSVPIVYLYFILTLPFNAKSITVILLGFLLGFSIDIFCNTLGVNAAATTLASFLRQPLLNIYLRNKENFLNKVPCIATMGLAIYIRYILILVALQILTISLLEYFNEINWIYFIPRLVCSIILSILIIIAIDFLFNSKDKK